MNSPLKIFKNWDYRSRFIGPGMSDLDLERIQIIKKIKNNLTPLRIFVLKLIVI